MHAIHLLAIASLSSASLAGTPLPERLVQIRSVDLQAGVIEIHNFGPAKQALDGWRFCTHSNSEARRYTGPAGLNGTSVSPGGSVFIHLNNDAPADPGNVNAATLGGAFAANFGQGPYAMQLFWPNGGSLSFASPEDMADHLQWSVMGTPNTVAQTRSQQAVGAGLWSAANAFIPTTGHSQMLVLLPLGGESHTPADYQVIEPNPACNDADNAEPFGVLDLADVNGFVGAFINQQAPADIAAPAGVWDLADVSAFITAFIAGCP